MNELSGMSDASIAKVFAGMIQVGEFPALVGMRMQACGGEGSIVSGGSGVFFRGHEVAVIGATYVSPHDAHGCPACPHHCTGIIVTGSRDVFANGIPVAIRGSIASHVGCCGSNSAIVAEGLTRAELG